MSFSVDHNTHLLTAVLLFHVPKGLQMNFQLIFLSKEMPEDGENWLS